jgi:hypothetical protein
MSVEKMQSQNTAESTEENNSPSSFNIRKRVHFITFLIMLGIPTTAALNPLARQEVLDYQIEDLFPDPIVHSLEYNFPTKDNAANVLRSYFFPQHQQRDRLEEVLPEASGVSTTPVPLPGAIWLMGSALLGLIGVKRQRTTA